VKVFKGERFIPISVPDLTPIGQELIRHFKDRGYEVNGMQAADGNWQVAITRGGMFKAVAGQRSALKIELEKRPNGTFVRAGAGVFGRQAIPGAISAMIWPPLLLVPIWGLIRQAGLDDEAIKVVEVSLTRTTRLGGPTGGGGGETEVILEAASPAVAEPPGDTPREPAAARSSARAFCTACGESLEADTRFCGSCGQTRTA